MTEYVDVTSVRFRRNRLGWQVFCTLHDVDPNTVQAVTIDDQRVTFHCYDGIPVGRYIDPATGQAAMVDVERQLIGTVPA